MFWKSVLSHIPNQSQLSRISGVNYAMINAQVRRNSLPRVDIALRIAKSVNCSIEELMEGKKGKSINPTKEAYQLNQLIIEMDAEYLNELINIAEAITDLPLPYVIQFTTMLDQFARAQRLLKTNKVSEHTRTKYETLLSFITK